jgi:integrase
MHDYVLKGKAQPNCPLAPSERRFYTQKRPVNPGNFGLRRTFWASSGVVTQRRWADNLSRIWGRVRSKAGVPDVTIHDLRRTFITRLVRAGVPMPTVQKLAGHSNIQTTLTYYNWVSTEDLRAGIRKLQRDVG